MTFRSTLVGLAVATLFAAQAWAQTPPPEADQTLSAADYAGHGLPSIDRAWTPGDFHDAVTALTALPPTQLPHYASAASGSTFQHVFDSATLAYCGDHSIDLTSRGQNCSALAQSAATIMASYLAQLQQDPQGRAEDFIRMMPFMLKMESMLIRLTGEVKPTLDSSAPDYATRMQGFAQMRDGVKTTLLGTIQMMDAAGAFSQPARAEVAAALASEEPTFSPFLADADRATFQAALHRLAQNDANPDVRAALSAYR